jgi:Fic family protein
MAAVRIVRRGRRAYRYLEQSYRWRGQLRKKRLYLGTSIPRALPKLKLELERRIWKDTWFADFDKIKAGYQRRLQTVPKSVTEQEHTEFVTEFTYNTNRIEGSTMTFEDTRLLLERGFVRSPRPAHDIMETQSHAKLLGRLMATPAPVSLANLRSWHKELFVQTKPDIAGTFRTYEVRIRGSKHKPPPPEQVEPMLKALVDWSRRSKNSLHACELAGEFHFRFEHIHPFGDGNGRVGRLAMNMLLFNSGYPMLNVPYTRRGGYYNALEEGDARRDPRRFLHWYFLRYSRSNQFYLGSDRHASS